MSELEDVSNISAGPNKRYQNLQDENSRNDSKI
jgi:hypothetical protein